MPSITRTTQRREIETPGALEPIPGPAAGKPKEKKRRPIAEIVVCVVWCAAAVGMLAYLPNILAPFNFKIYDMKVRLSRPPKAHPDIIHLDVDDTAILKYGQWPWDRSMSGKTVERLHEFGAKAVLFDVLYCAAGRSEEGNLAFFEAIKKAGNVISATGLGITSDYDEKLVMDEDSSRADALYEKSWIISGDPSFTPPKVNSLRNSYVPMVPIISLSAELGHVKAVPDSDGVHRRFPILVRLEDRYVPSLALAALRIYWKLKLSDISPVDGRTLEISRRGQSIRAPLDSDGSLIVRWGDAWDTFPHYSVVDLLSEEPDPMRKSRYQNKVVVVGFAATGNTDQGITPLAVNVPMSRIHSFALNTVLTNSFIRQIPAFPWVVTATVLITILFSVAATRLRWRVGLITAFAICMAFA
ncbi:MAG: CHASE2 domain-containing protein, partial [Deltaproteobacteria bacterium]|nr:CHASE2 domain-containing protein [Deltaproteobacteria bacterium]